MSKTSILLHHHQFSFVLDPRAAAGRSGPGFGLANRLRYDLTIPPPGSVAAAAAAAGMLGCGLPAPVAAFSSLSAPPETEYNFLMVSE